MSRSIICRFFLGVLIAVSAFLNMATARADNRGKDEDRLQNSGQVMKEVLDIPDNIPQKLLDRLTA
jgi:hypothetical protein